MHALSRLLAFLLVLIFANESPARAANDNDQNEALLRAESAYNNANSENKKAAEARFLQLLLESTNSDNRIVRRRATYLSSVYFSDNPTILLELLRQIEPATFESLRTEGRINTFHLLTEISDEAWNQDLVATVRNRLEEIVASPPPNWGPKQAEYLQVLRNRATQLSERPAVTIDFGTIQESNPAGAKFTDIDLFICAISQDDEELVTETSKLGKRLADQDFGRVRLRVWPADAQIPASELQGHSTLFFDEFLPEATEVGRVEKIFSESRGLPAFRAVSNQGEASSWYLSLFICPARDDSPTIPSRLWLHVQHEAQKALAATLLDVIRGEAFSGAPIDLRPIRMVTIGPKTSQLRYFKRSDEARAQALLGYLQNSVQDLKLIDMSEDYSAYDWIEPGHFELWLSPDLVKLKEP